MKPMNLYLLLLAVITYAAAQSEDALHIPEENDNQFPPDDNLETDGIIIEGSGAGAIEEPPIDVTATTESSPPPVQEDLQQPISENIEPAAEKSIETSCPEQCVCHTEGESNDYVVDCSGYDLTNFPTLIDTKTTTLNIQNNKLTEIPKEVSLLKNLKVLNADNNSIMEIASGSISELPELRVLKLKNNRMIEYPKDLKNGFGLTKLEELDLGGNDMRTSLNRDIFSHFTALKKLTVPTGTKELVEDLCLSLKESLVTVCTESCSTRSFDCPEARPIFDDDFLNVILPGTIALSSAFEGNADPATSEDANIDSDKIQTTEASEEQAGIDSNVTPVAPKANGGAEFSLRSSVNKAPEEISPLSTLVEAPKEATDNSKVDVAVGATTSISKTGGVDKSVIGIIVAGMVLVVAGITMKKNWSSIKKRFSSSPRAANERPGANANGTAPEEVPLQEKSPV